MQNSSNMKYRPKHLTIDDIRNGCITLCGDDDEETKLCMMQEEFRQGIDVIRDFTPSVTFYGSTRLLPEHPDYIKAYRLAYRISKELGYNILSGGGGGIMEAVSKGGFDANGKSVGLTIRLPREQLTNQYVTNEIPFYFFFARQVAMSYATEVCIFCPGGFGTLDELFEMITLQQTGKIGRIPVILFGSEFWNPLNQVVKEVLMDKYKTVDSDDMSLFIITDDEDEILKIIASSKLRDGQDALA